MIHTSGMIHTVPNAVL